MEIISRLLSFGMALFFVVTIYLSDGAEDAWKVGVGMIFILALVWFGDEMGSFVGGAAPAITAPTPGWMLRGFGWLILIGAFVASLHQLFSASTK